MGAFGLSKIGMNIKDTRLRIYPLSTLSHSIPTIPSLPEGVTVEQARDFRDSYTGTISCLHGQ